MKILIYAPSLFTARCGAERFASLLANWLAGHGHAAAVCRSASDRDLQSTYPLHEDVQILDIFRDNDKIGQNREILRDFNADVFLVLSYGNTAAAAIASAYTVGTPVVISERSTPEALNHYLGSGLFRLGLYAGADYIHLLSSKYLDSLPDFLRERARIIPNPMWVPTMPPDFNARSKIILAVGRLQEEIKNHSLLIRAFALLAPEYPDWKLVICGEGHSRKFYEELAQRLGNQISMPGVIANLRDSQYPAAAIFCIPSRYEGMPMALLEARAQGLPAVGFGDCTGVNELIHDGKDGILVKKRTPRALAGALETLMNNACLRRKMGHAAWLASRDYSPEMIFPQWLDLFEQAAARKGRTALDFPPLSEKEQIMATLKAFVSRKGADNPRQAKNAPASKLLCDLRARLISK